MTVTRVPARNPEPEGLDGRGTTHAADLPPSVWQSPWRLAVTEDLDLDADVPVKRSLCLLVDPEGDYVMPGRCKKPRGHEEPHDWGANHGAFLGETRRAELQDTPSGRLPVRTPGAALREEREVIERWPA